MALWNLEGRENYCQLVVAKENAPSDDRTADEYFKLPNYDDLSGVFIDLITSYSDKSLQMRSNESTEKEIDEFIKNYFKKNPDVYCTCLNNRDCYEIDEE